MSEHQADCVLCAATVSEGAADHCGPPCPPPSLAVSLSLFPSLYLLSLFLVIVI